MSEIANISGGSVGLFISTILVISTIIKLNPLDVKTFNYYLVCDILYFFIIMNVCLHYTIKGATELSQEETSNYKESTIHLFTFGIFNTILSSIVISKFKYYSFKPGEPNIFAWAIVSLVISLICIIWGLLNIFIPLFMLIVYTPLMKYIDDNTTTSV